MLRARPEAEAAGVAADAENVYFHTSAICRADKGLRPRIQAGAKIEFDLVRAERGEPCGEHAAPANYFDLANADAEKRAKQR